MAYANTAATAKHNALRNTHTIQGVKPTPAPGGAPGVMVTTYTSTKLGIGQVVARLLNSNAQVVAYRVMYNRIPHTLPAGNGSAIGTMFVPYSIIRAMG